MKNYLQLLGCFMLLLCSQVLWAQQIDFTLRYNLANNEYEVYGKPDFSDPAFFVGGGSQISVVLPASVNNTPLAITSVNGGSWFDNSQIYAPAADAVHDFHGIASNGSAMAWVSGEETLLFTFTFTGGACLPGIRLFENASDPQDTDAGMAGGDFNNYFADAFTFVNRYNVNYDNAGTNCDPPLIIPNPLTIPQDSTGTVCLPVLDLTPNDTFSVTICGVENGTVNETISGANVCLEYTPTAGFSGTDSICVIICDKLGFCDTTSVPVTVVPPLPPTITPLPPTVIPTPITVPEDSTAMVCTPILDPNVGDVFNATVCTGSPANGTATPTIVGNTLCLEYTPDMGYTGDDPICIIVCDQTGLCDTVTIPVSVIPTPAPYDSLQPPIIVLPPVVTPEDSTTTICGPVVDANPGDTHTVTICEQPANGVATATIDNTSGQVCLTFDPAPNFIGKDSVCVLVCDQTGLCDSLIVPIIVTSTNTHPVAIDDINSTIVDTPISGTVITNDFDAENDNLSVNTTPLNEMNGTVVIDAMGNYTFTPSTGFVGEASFQYLVCDDGNPSLCDTATVIIDIVDSVHPDSNTVIGVTDNFVTENDNPLTGDLLANDSDPEGDNLIINMTPVTDPITGTLGINLDGTFSFTPAPGFVGQETFEYQVCDDGTPMACDTVLVTIEVLQGDGMNDIYATDDANTGTQNEVLTGNVTDNDNDPENDNVTVTLLDSTANGNLVLNPDGAYMYIPNMDFIGSDAFVYMICDDGSPVACDSATVYLTVLVKLAAPIVIPNPLTIPQDSTGTICMPITDVNNGDTFTANLCTVSPTNGTATPTVMGNTLCLEYIPTAGFSGTDEVCIIVCDQTGLCDTTMVPITVVPVLPPTTTPEPPIVIPSPITTLEDTTATVCMPILDQNVGDTFTANICTGSPANGTATPTIVGNTLCMEYTPNMGYTGDDPVCVIVCDQTGLCDTITVPVYVIPVPEPTDSMQPPVVILPPVVTPIDSTIVVCGVVVDPNLNDTFSAAICQQPSNGTATVSIDNNTDEVCLTFDPNNGFVGPDSVCVIVCDQTDLCDSVQVPITVISTIWVLDLKMMLQGAMFSTNDGLMRDDLRQQSLIPLQQPYNAGFATRFTHVGGGSETTTTGILNADAGTPDAIVDWVFVEFRDWADSSSIVQTRSALVQRDGDVVDAVTGERLVVTSLPITSAYISVKHRNHLGAMIAQPVTFNRGPVTVDFTTMVDADLYNQTGYDDLEMTTVSGKRALWAGNANTETKVKYDGIFNDRIVISSEIWLHPGNAFSTLNFDSAIGYYQGDINLDGKTKYDGLFNDRVLIQNNVLLYPLNTQLLNNFNQMIEQLP